MPTQICVAVVGAGGVGKAFLGQLATLAQRLAARPAAPYHLALVLVSRSSVCVQGSEHNPIGLDSWQSQLRDATRPAPKPAQIVDFLAQISGPTVLVDNTSSADLAESYPLFLARGTSVVTPNKKAFSGDIALWDAIFGAAANGTGAAGAGAGHVFHESSVGAGIPIISTLKEIVETGDEVRRIEGVFSGTMSFLFNNFMPAAGGGGAFSAEVANAKALGYTEPDPRDDLNGLDVARKLTILARLAGLRVASATAFPCESLIPAELESCASGDDFLARLPEFDERMEALRREAAAEGKVLRYVGSIDVASGKVEGGLRRYEASHPIAGLVGSNNIFTFHTKRYTSPLIIQAEGAGGEITAMGVTGDLIKVCNLVR